MPLNIFEPRYVEMINDSIKSNKFIGMIQPKPIINSRTKKYMKMMNLMKVTICLYMKLVVWEKL